MLETFKSAKGVAKAKGVRYFCFGLVKTQKEMRNEGR